MTFTGTKKIEAIAIGIGIAITISIFHSIIAIFLYSEFTKSNHSSMQSDKEIKALFNNSFPGILVKNITKGPADTWIINSELNDEEKFFYVLPDSSHVIEGKMLSLYAEQHLQPAVTKKITKSQELEEQFIAKLKAKRTEVSNKKNNSYEKNEASHPFKLPELNSVLTSEDKGKFYARTKELEYIEIGDKSAPLIHIFFDFNCSGCRQAKKVLQKFADRGDLLIRYIPVGVIHKESAIKAAYSLIPANNADRNILLHHFVKPGTAEELIESKAPKTEVLRALRYVNEANKVFMFTPKKLTPTFTFELDGEVVIANLTSEKSIQNLVDRLRKQ